MPGGYPLGPEITSATKLVGLLGVGLPIIGFAFAGGSANNYGPWVQLVASTQFDISFLDIIAYNFNIASNTNAALQIAIGASGQEISIINDLMLVGSGSVVCTSHFGIPISIPAGTRIAGRVQTKTAEAATISVLLQSFDAAFTQVEGYAGVDSIGFVAASTQGTTIPVGGSFVYDPYVQIIASTLRDYAGIFWIWDFLNTTYPNASNNTMQFDLAIGASGSESNIMSGIQFPCTASGQVGTSPTWTGIHFIPIPAGTRLAMQAASNGTTVKGFGVTVYGLYQ
jgi:hypothetical protein